jgi:hypothetical protein
VEFGLQPLAGHAPEATDKTDIQEMSPIRLTSLYSQQTAVGRRVFAFVHPLGDKVELFLLP